MVKQSPKLRLVGKDDGASKSLEIADGLGFTALEELSSGETKRLERVVSHTCSRGAVLAVARTALPWDIRPVLALPDENDPSLIRFAGPEATISTAGGARLRELYDRLSKLKADTAALIDFGTFEDQVWCRRRLLPTTLAHLLTGDNFHDLSEAKAIMDALIDEISDWHSLGLIHGHIASSNIAVASRGAVLLLDAGLGCASCRTKSAAERYGQSIAPELSEGADADYASDVYGLGQVIRRIVVVLRKNHQFKDDSADVERTLEPYFRAASRMVEPRAERRPALTEIRAQLREPKKSEKSPVFAGEVHQAAPPAQIPGSGRLVARVEAPVSPAPRQEEVPRPGERKPGEKGLHSVLWSRDAEESPAPVQNEEQRPYRGAAASEHSFAEPNRFYSDELEEEEDFFGFEPGTYSNSSKTADRFGPAAAPAPAAEPRPVQPPAEAAGGFWTFLFVLGLIMAGSYYYIRVYQPAAEVHDLASLNYQWQGKIRSRMAEVAQIAVSNSQARADAEEVIVRSVMNGDTLDSGVDAGLLRVAFNGRWEKDLTVEDRRMALALGLAGLLDGNLPADLGAIEQRHPGIVLAVAGSAGKNVNRFLKTIPAGVLTKLPAPYGAAFVKLLLNQEGKTCADRDVQAFARFCTRGVQRSQEVAEFLSENGRQRLFALAVMFASDNQLARELLAVLVDHPNISIDQPEIKWAREWGLTKWGELEPGDQLFILAGAPPAEKVELQNVASMMMHPAPEIRVYAVQQALDRIKFAHPGSWQVLQRLIKQPEIITPEQLSKLAYILENPSKATSEKINDWLNTVPPLPMDLLSDLLLATSEQQQSTEVDRWVAFYLKKHEWQPDVVTLKRLAGHPDDYTRLFAYGQIYLMKDRDTARVFLKSVLGKEKKAEYRAQLEKMISYLR